MKHMTRRMIRQYVMASKDIGHETKDYVLGRVTSMSGGRGDDHVFTQNEVVHQLFAGHSELQQDAMQYDWKLVAKKPDFEAIEYFKHHPQPPVKDHELA